MSELPARARMLLAWEKETDTLTSRTVMTRARTTDVHEFLGMADRGFIEKLPWRPHTENLYRLTTKGLDERERHVDFQSILTPW